MYSLIWSRQSFQLKDADWTHYAVICFLGVNRFGLNGNLIRMQPLEMCFGGAFLMLMKADTVSTSLVSQWQTLARPLLFVAGSSGSSPYLSRLQRCPHRRTVLRPFQTSATCFYNYTTPTWTPWWTGTKLLVVTFFNPCLSNLTSCFVHHHTFTLLPRPQRLAPLVSEEPGALGGHHNTALKSSD